MRDSSALKAIAYLIVLGAVSPQYAVARSLEYAGGEVRSLSGDGFATRSSRTAQNSHATVALGESNTPVDAFQANNAFAKKSVASMAVTQNNAVASANQVVADAKALAAEERKARLLREKLRHEKFARTMRGKPATTAAKADIEDDRTASVWPAGGTTLGAGTGVDPNAPLQSNTPDGILLAHKYNNSAGYSEGTVPPGEGPARQEAAAQQGALLKLLLESRKEEQEQEEAAHDDIRSIVETEKLRYNELLAETKMNTSDNAWYDLPKWKPDTNKTYPAPTQPKKWLDIYGPNAISRVNGTEIHIAYDMEGYPKPWNASASTPPKPSAPSPTANNAGSSTEQTKQNEFDKDLRNLDLSEASSQLQERRQQHPRLGHGQQKVHATHHQDDMVTILDDQMLGTAHVQVGGQH